MKLYFDNKMLYIRQEDRVIVYSPYNHKLIRTDINAGNIVKEMVDQGSGTDFELGSDAIHFVESLIQYKIFFSSKEAYEEDSYLPVLDSLKNQYIPSVAYIHVTQRCNLQCTYCYNKRNLNQWKDLSTQEWKYIIDQLYQKGLTKLVFTGGEPFLRKDLYDLVNYAKEKKFEVQILSNGTLLDKVPYEIFHYVDNVIVSLDSLNEVVNNMNRTNGIHYSTLDNLKKLPIEYRNKIQVRSVLTKNNIDELEVMQDYFESNHYQYITTIFIPNSMDEIELMPELDFSRFKEHMQNYKFPSRIMSCGACYKEIAINSNGDIYPCHNLIKPEFLITNIHNEDWYDIVRDSQVSKMITRLSVDHVEKCKDCSIRYICGGGCRSIAYNVYGKLDAPLEFFCDYLGRESIEKLKLLKYNSSNK